MAGEIVKQINRLDRALDPRQLAKEAYGFFKQTTPVDTGRARRNTKLSGDEILAQYPYAVRLDQGYSRQAPDGMTRPTEKFVERYIKRQPR
jgi:hypothetical protein